MVYLALCRQMAVLCVKKTDGFRAAVAICFYDLRQQFRFLDSLTRYNDDTLKKLS